ncbi:DUF5801 repeats-in-toxin domain-containing protein [Mesorhizobium sp. B2-6-5]|uniref:DUF5801 repeats-in-toxin domain-containing protein n=1 Tax=Mesorhizobium sp. B2-6-5 TaxID=2589912 RepID=UPI00112A66D9|nr:DUF5801 repeats-in-toxin domain-containing protein [Mesorhizobium sp. B2-6-5]TPJ36041.1 hypothetical protein FJ432_27315 [Mesorhizobium sp. B2-6-5]
MLDITAQDIIVDETTGLQQPSEIDPTGNSNPTLVYLLSRDGAGGLASPQVAFQSDFVMASASAGETINSVILTQNNSGTPFSTNVGVNSGIQTVDGNYVWLFQDPTHANVVIGVIGTSSQTIAPAADGSLAFSFGLSATSTTHADLYLVEYVPLLHPDTSNPDDRIDLNGKVFASVSGSTVVNFSQLGDAPPGHNKWYILDADAASPQKILVTAHDNGVQAEVNISTQGLGVSSQDVRFGRELQIDLINGGTQSAGKNFTNSPLAPDYGSHIETVISAGFSVSQSTPTNTKSDIEIHTYNNNDNAEGAALPGDDNDAEINISAVTFKLNGVATTAAALGITVDDSGPGLILHDVGEGVTVDFTADATFDRFTIKNVDTQKDYFDVKEVHFGGQSTNAYTEQVGSFINFDDDGPAASLTEETATLLHDETSGVDLNSDDQPLGSLPAAFVALGSAIGWASSASAVVTPNSNFGADAPGTETLSLGVSGPNADSGFDSLDGHNILLNVENGLVIGRVDVSNDGSVAGDPVALAISIGQNGILSIAQYLAIAHSNPGDADDVQTMLDSALVAKLHAVDGDGDSSDTSTAIGDKVQIRDDGPSITADGTKATITVDESNLGDNSGDFSAAFHSNAGADGGDISYALGINLVTNDSGLTDTLTGQSVLLFVEGDNVVGRAGSAGGAVVFTVSVDIDGNVTLDQARAVIHSPDTGPDQPTTLTSDDLVTLTATITDGDGDQATDTAYIGTSLVFKDDAPTITAPFDGDQTGTAGTPETLANTTSASAIGAFGYDVGADAHPAAFYTGGGSDFVDRDSGLAGIQLSLGGNLTGLAPGTTPFISSFATLQSEDAHQASFNWQITYDSDPNSAADPPATAGGTLVFNKDADTYTITLNDAVEGFTKDILHTSELLSKEPTSNTGHPNIVVEKLFEADSTPETTDRDFFVQFTANSTTNTIKFGLNTTGDSDTATPADTAWNPGDLVTNSHEDWVSATQSTNGVAGDTIQKGELLTLRFFDHSPTIATEDVVPNQTASDMAIKFDGIGSSEDLMVILQLVSSTDSSMHTSKAVYISNADIYKTGQVPAAYAADFPLDNNDGLVIIEKNDYNAAGENWVIQGAQIMQSGNGITGDNTAIDLQRAIGSGGGSSQTTLVNWDATDNDVLKIVDLGFTSTQTTTPDAHLDFGVQIADADGDTTTVQHILVDIA